MTEQDRGAYTPQTDAPLAFDARYSRGSGERPIPLALVVSGVILVTLVVTLLFLYRTGPRSTGQAPAVVGTPVADTKAPPSAQPESADPAAGMHVYKAEAVPAHEGGSTTTAAVLAPGPETAGPRPVAATPIDEAKLRPAQANLAGQTVVPAPATAPVAATVTPAGKAPVKLAAKPVPATTVSPAAAAPVKTAAATKTSAAPNTAASARTDAAEIPTGAPVAQIGAFSSSALAEKGWSDVAVLMPGQMAGKSRKIEMATVNGKTFYRGFVGGFASKSAAESFCASLKAAGKGCIVK